MENNAGRGKVGEVREGGSQGISVEFNLNGIHLSGIRPCLLAELGLGKGWGQGVRTCPPALVVPAPGPALPAPERPS